MATTKFIESYVNDILALIEDKETKIKFLQNLQ